jgi:predicted ester cyclase
MEQDNKTIVAQLVETLNRGDLDTHMQLYASEGINHGFRVKRDDIRHVLEDIRTTFPDMTFETLRIVANGEWVALHTRVSGTHLGVGKTLANGGMLVDVLPTGKPFTTSQIHMWRIRNQQVVEHYACRDDIEMMRQLHLLPAIS